MAGITNPIVSTAEIQTITVNATGGTFTVTWNGTTTSALAFNVSAAAFTTAMALVADGAGNVTVTGGPGAAGGGTPYTLTWAAGRGNVPAPTTDAALLTGGAGTAAVATITAGVTGLADPWLSVGTHDAPTSTIPDQGDWQWCMMEVASWMAGESWSTEPANVSPVIAAACNAFNDLLGDDQRQDLKAFLVVAPAGVIDTVDAGKETAREWMGADWLVRTLVPLWLGYIADADVSAAAADIVALPALAAGTFDEAATLAALEVAGRAVWAWQATQELGAFEQVGGGGPVWATASLPDFYDLFGGDYIDHYFGLIRGLDGFTPEGWDNGAEVTARAFAAARQATWDTMLSWVPVEFFTGRSSGFAFRKGGDYVAGSAFMLLRDIIWALVTNPTTTGALAAAYLGTAVGFGKLYAVAADAATSYLAGGLDVDTLDACSDLLTDLCAA